MWKGEVKSQLVSSGMWVVWLVQDLSIIKGKKGTVYTDSKCAFGTVHSFGKIWKERGLINTQGKELVHEELIQKILEALQEPEETAVVHVRGHQKGMSFLIRENSLTDQAAKEAALQRGEISKLQVVLV